ncbi:AraC family transcriptional regulator [Marinobacter sp. F4216]|uniref:AraC family transcriptional regulator n=1 Tax=Marinobacter sp. F4216 TaxID=2874281 RepID=UPI001CBE7551|nr:AraC family transcriptional regulator [Marinobacter sp. F4216]MBZ2169823.1 AraC family transcriptional regulator [Marinobacter sp. F4216]
MTHTMLRARSMTGVAETIRELGGDPKRFLADFHLNEEMSSNPKQMIPYLTLIQMLERAAVDFNCPDFGIRVGLKQGLSVLGPIAVIAENSATVENALQHIIKYISYHSPSIHLRLDPPTPEKYRGLHFEIAITQGQTRAQTIEMSLLLATKVIRALIGDENRLLPLHFRHPRVSPLARYRAAYKTPVTFETNSNTVYIPTDALAAEIRSRDPALKQMMEEYVTQNIDTTAYSLQENVRSLVISLLPLERRCTIPLIAKHLVMSERTLQRRLKKENIVFEGLVDEVRRELAKDYLSDQRMTISQIAGLIGYGQQSSFNRACMRWFGKSPKTFREEVAVTSH